METTRWLPLPQAIDIYCEHLGIAGPAAHKLKEFARTNTDNVILLSDRPLTVHREASGWVVDAEELSELLESIQS